MEQVFNEIGRLIRDQTEIIGVTMIDFKELAKRSTSLLCSRAYQITHAETYIFSDSVPCVGKVGDEPIEVWKNKIRWYLENNHLKDLNRIDGKPTEFEWKIFTGFTTLDFLEKIQDLMEDQKCEPEQFNDRIILMSMYNDIAWGETQKCVNTIQRQLRIMLADSLAVVGLSWNLDQKRSGTEPTLVNPTDPGTKLQNK